MQAFPAMYPNTVKCLTMTVKNEGFFRGLYAGTTPSLAANVGENAVLFCAYGYCQKAVSSMTGRHGDDMTVMDKSCSGFLAAFFSSLVLCPTELIKCKLQSIKEKGHKPISAFSLTQQIIRTQGIKGMFNGLSSTILREMPGYFTFFFGIEGTKKILIEHAGFDRTSTFVPLGAGAVGGICLWLTIFPFDLIKSRIQIDNSSLTLPQMFLKIVREEGAKNLYRGLTPTLIRTIPATAALFYTYEKTKLLLL